MFVCVSVISECLSSSIVECPLSPDEVTPTTFDGISGVLKVVQSNLDVKTTFGLKPKWPLYQGGLYTEVGSPAAGLLTGEFGPPKREK